MTFNLKNFVMKTLEGMATQYDEFQVREYALKWYSKGVLTDDDLMAIEQWYAETETETDEPTDTVETPTEETAEETIS